MQTCPLIYNPANLIDHEALFPKRQVNSSVQRVSQPIWSDKCCFWLDSLSETICQNLFHDSIVEIMSADPSRYTRAGGPGIRHQLDLVINFNILSFTENLIHAPFGLGRKTCGKDGAFSAGAFLPTLPSSPKAPHPHWVGKPSSQSFTPHFANGKFLPPGLLCPVSTDPLGPRA